MMSDLFCFFLGSVVRWLFGLGLVGSLVVLIVPLFLSSFAMPGLCCCLRVTHTIAIIHHQSPQPVHSLPE